MLISVVTRYRLANCLSIGMIQSYPQALVYYLLIIGLFFFTYWSHLVAPHRQELELGAPYSGPTEWIENRKFSDQTSVYIPEISEHLKAARSGWLALWTNKTELGRPLFHLSGFSPAYLPSWLISKVSADPWQFLTVLTIGSCILSGFFILLFAREVSMSPIAGLVAAISLATSPLLAYWVTFPMFTAVWCWGAGTLWAITRLSKNGNFFSWVCLAFCVYSLLMTGYPQSVIFHAYFLGGYGLYLLAVSRSFTSVGRLKLMGLILSSVFFGGSVAIPVFYDVLAVAAESARSAPDASFFTSILPKITDYVEAGLLLSTGIVPEIYGNPISPDYPLSYDGLSVTAPMLFLALVAFTTAFSKSWGWSLAILLPWLFTFVRPLYLFGVDYLGFNLSRSSPLGTAMLPFSILVGIGLDCLIRKSHKRELQRSVIFSGLVILFLTASGIILGILQNLLIKWLAVCILVLAIALLMMQSVRFSPLILWLVLGACIFNGPYQLLLKQDRRDIKTTSPLINSIRESLPAGSRYAIMAPGLSLLPPNINASVGLPSIHSYNSLSSTRYHELIKSLGGDTKTYGRRNTIISPNFNSEIFWMTNVGLILSPRALEHKNLEFLAKEANVYFYRVVSRMGESTQVLSPQIRSRAQKKLTIFDLPATERHSPVKLQDQGDFLEFSLKPMRRSIFILSQKYHKDWQAWAWLEGNWNRIHSLEINGIFQGFLLPAGAQKIKLQFEPLSNFAWVGHLIWLITGCVVLARPLWVRHQANL